MSKSKKKQSKASKKNASSKPSKKRASLARNMEGMMRNIMDAVGDSMAFRHATR